MPYSYHQSHQQITLLLEVSWDTRTSDVAVTLSEDSVVAGLKGCEPLLKGRLIAPIVPSASSWYLERRPGGRRGGRTSSTRTSATTTSLQSTHEDAPEEGSNDFSPRPERDAPGSPQSASSFSSDPIRPPPSSSHRSGRRGPESETSSFGSGSGGDWIQAGGMSDEGEMISHPVSPNLSNLSSSGFLPSRDTDDLVSAPPSMEASSILQPPSSSEESANSTGSGLPSSSSVASPRTPEVAPRPPTRLLTVYLVKAIPKIWDQLVIVGGLEGEESLEQGFGMDTTSLASLASEKVHRGFIERDQAFTMLLHAYKNDRLPLASHLLLQHFFAPPILHAENDDSGAAINPSHIFRLGGTAELALFYLNLCRIYLLGPLPPPPPHHRFPTGAAHRPSSARQLEIAKSLLTHALLANPKVSIDDLDLRALAKDMGFRRSKSGVWKRVPTRGRTRGSSKSILSPPQGLYLLGGALLMGAAGWFWWQRKAALMGSTRGAVFRRAL